MSLEEDRDIVARVLAGDKAAFGALIERHRASALAFSRRILDANEAEDAVQEAFLAAFLGIKALRDAGRFRAWLFGIVANVCRYRLRRTREGYFRDEQGGRLVTGFMLEDAQPSAEAVFEIRELHRIVSDAIGELPDEQRQAVTLHYLHGLTLAEIAILTAAPVGTLKARLHHARARLKESLIASLSVTPKHTREQGLAMIEVIVLDVVTRAAVNQEVKTLSDAYGRDAKLGFWRVILLKERAGRRILPIWVGPWEGDVIALQLEHIETPRPGTFDLTTHLLELSGAKIEKVAVTELRNNVYFGMMWLNAGGNKFEVDARPSDAIMLALQADAPIYLASETLEGNKTVISAADEEIKWKTLEQSGPREPEAQPMEYRSVRGIVREAYAKPASD
ncbi:MAG: bifunctional nuclease family protein [Deltaproteobacteria bacterium]|nr:bifunctional nuclease family protein [Deltaproteobacteria bacterium]